MRDFVARSCRANPLRPVHKAIRFRSSQALKHPRPDPPSQLPQSSSCESPKYASNGRRRQPVTSSRTFCGEGFRFDPSGGGINGNHIRVGPNHRHAGFQSVNDLPKLDLQATLADYLVASSQGVEDGHFSFLCTRPYGHAQRTLERGRGDSRLQHTDPVAHDESFLTALFRLSLRPAFPNPGLLAR